MRVARSKLSNIRLKSFIWLLMGLGFLYLYFIFKIAKIFVFLGGLALLLSFFMYSRAGHFATKAKEITCPQCGKKTKVVSRADACSHCRTPIIDDGRGIYKVAKQKKQRKS